MNSLRLNLDLGERSYTIRIGSGLLATDTDLRASVRGKDALIVTNETIEPLYAASLEESLGGVRLMRHVLPDGERFKTVEHVESIYDSLVTMGAGRDTTIVALGGGVVGDMAGFAAATYQRGVAFVQVPTTLLAQVDSSVGGKTGVNHPRGKNLIGAFHQPRYVLIDIDTLATLPDREFSAGLAEVIKYGLAHDAEFFQWLEQNMVRLRAREPDALMHAIRRSCEIKAAVVAADERESGQRALLNFGHTFGHAIENLAGYGEWLHGEAVAAGMCMAVVASGLGASDRERIEQLIAAAGLPLRPPALGRDRMLSAMQLDKKVLDGKMRLVLLREIGSGYVSSAWQQDALEAALAYADD